MKISGLACALIVVVFACSATADKASAASRLVEIQTLVATIQGETGGVDILRIVPILQVRNAADGAAIRRNQLPLERAMRARLRSVSARQLIPPRGGTTWLEQELWKIAEQVLTPVRLESLFFRELTIY